MITKEEFIEAFEKHNKFIRNSKKREAIRAKREQDRIIKQLKIEDCCKERRRYKRH